MQDEHDGWLTKEEVAARLGRTTRTIERYLEQGKLTGEQVGYKMQWRIDPESLAKLDVVRHVRRQKVDIIPPDHLEHPVQVVERLHATINEQREEIHELRVTMQGMAEELKQVRETLDRLASPHRRRWPWQRSGLAAIENWKIRYRCRN